LEREKYNLIYEYYACHILFGHFEYGSCLPTIEQIGNSFHVAPQTVHNALMKLQMDGLVRILSGRPTTVVYKATDEVKHQFAENYYLARKNAIEEVYSLSHFLLMPLFHEGCRRLSDADLQQILSVARQENSNIVSISMFCCNIMIDALNNWLAKGLFLDMVSFFQFPYVPSFNEDNNEEYKKYHRLLTEGCEKLDRENVFCAFSYFQTLTQKTLQNFIDHAWDKTTATEQISFRWQTYRDRPQHCHTLAASIIKNILSGAYSEKNMLPSYEKTASEFSVSISTVRRTIELLRDMGIIHTINGVGNQIQYSAPNLEKLQRPAIQKNIRMAGESIEILFLTTGAVIHRVFPNLEDDQITSLRNMLNKKRTPSSMDIVLFMVQYFMEAFSSPLIYEVYNKLLEFLFFVYPLLSNPENADNQESVRFIKKMDQGLRDKNMNQFTQGFLELLNAVQDKIVKRLEIMTPYHSLQKAP